MASNGAVKLSILSTYDSTGTAAAEKAITSFTKKWGTLNEATGQMELDSTTTSLLNMSTSAVTLSNKLQKVSSTATSVGSVLTKSITVPIAALATTTISAATEMETSFANVRKTLDTTEEGYEKLYDACVEMSTVHAISAADTAEIMALGAQLGISEEALESFAETVYGLDIATDLDAETAATDLAQFANICGTAEDELENVSSTVVALGNTSATTESTIMDMATRLASSGTQAGMSEANILALSASLASLGMEAEAGGTALSTVITNIDKAVATNSDELSTWASTAGMSVEEFTTAWEAGGDSTTAAFAAVVEGMASTNDEGGNLAVLLEDLGVTSIRQSDAMKRLASSGDLLSESIETANTAYGENTALSEEVANFEDTLANKFEILKNKVTAAAITIGEPLVEALSDVIDNADPLIDAVTNAAQAFADMDSEQQNTIIKLGLTAAAIGPAVTLFGKLAGVASSATGTFAKITAALAKYRVQAAAAATASGTVTSATTTAASSATALSTTVTNTSSKLSAVSTAASSAGSALKTFAGGAAAIVAITGLTVMLTSIVSGFKDAWEQTHKATEALSDFETAANNSVSGLSNYDASLSSLADTSDETTSSLDTLYDSLSEHATAMNEATEAAQTELATLADAQSTVEQYVGKTDLSTEAQGELATALETLNDALGTSITAEDVMAGEYTDTDGAVQDLTTSINELVAAKKNEIKLASLNSAYEEAYNANVEACDAAAEAQLAYNEAYQEAYDYAVSHNISNPEQWAEGQSAVRAAATELENASAAAELTQASMDDLEYEIGDLTRATSDSATAYDTWGNTMSQTFESTLTASGQSLAKLKESLQEAGVDVSDLETLTETELLQLAQDYDGTTNSVVSSLDGMGIACGDAGNYAVEALSSALSSGTVDVETAASALQDAANGDWSGVISALEQAGYDMPSSLASALSSGSYEVDDELGALLDSCSTAATDEDYESIYSELGAEIPSGLEQGINDNSDITTTLSTFVNNIIQSVKDFFGIASPSTVFAEIGGNLVDGLAQGLSENAGGGILSSAIETVKSTITGFFSSAGTWLSTTGSNITAGLSSGISGAKQKATTAAGTVKSTVSTTLSNLTGTVTSIGSSVTSKFSSGISGAKSKVTSAANTAKNAASTSWTNFKSTASSLGASITDKLGSGMSGAKSKVTSAASTVKSAASSGVQSAITAATSWGSHLTKNFASGIKSAVSYATSAASSVMSKVKSILGFSVPEEGPFSGSEKGGVTSGKHLIENFATGMVSAASDVESAAETSLSKAAGVFNSSSLGTTISVSGTVDSELSALQAQVSLLSTILQEIQLIRLEGATKAATGNTYNITLNGATMDTETSNTAATLIQTLVNEVTRTTAMGVS